MRQFQSKSLRTLLPNTGRCLEQHIPTDTIPQQGNQSVCHVAEELRAVLGDTIPGDIAEVSTPFTSPHAFLPQVLIYVNNIKIFHTGLCVPCPPLYI